MRRLIAYFIDNSLVVNLITVALLVVGLVSMVGLKKETFPDISFDRITVTTIYPGSSSEDVEKLVTIPLERKIKGVDGIKELNALSAEGNSIIYLEVDPDYEIKDVFDDVRNAVDTVTDLPDEAKVPIVTEIKRGLRGIVLIPVFGPDFQKVRVAAKMLRDELEQIDEVARIDLGGYDEEQIKIQVDPTKLQRYQLTVGEVAQAIQQRNLNLSAGKLETSQAEIMVRTDAEFKDLDEVRDVVVRSNASGVQIRVRDVAIIKREIPADAVIERSNGKRAIFLDVKKRVSADIIRTMDKVTVATQDFFKQKRWEDLSYNYTNDESYYVKRRLGVLVDNGVLGILLVVVCLYLFLNLRTSLITSFGAPLAFMTAFAFMLGAGLTINLISMFGLIMVLGMLVDDAIIVAEQFYQLKEQGMNKKEAALEAVIQTVKPVSATIITTMMAFSSIFFMGGIMGKFLWPVPAVVILCLLASWLECFFILPNHLADFTTPLMPQVKRRWYDPLRALYRRSLAFFLKIPKTTCCAFLLMFVASLLMARRMKFELFPGDDVRTLSVNAKGPVGIPLEQTEQVMDRLEGLILKELSAEELEQTRTWIGRQFQSRGSRQGSHYGTVMTYLTPPDERERQTDEIIQLIQKKASDQMGPFEITIEKLQGGPPKGKAVDIELYSDSLEDLKLASKKILSQLSQIQGVLTPEIDFEEGKQQIIAVVNEGEAKRLGLSTQQVALELRRALAGDEVTQVRESDEDIDIIVQLQKQYRSSLHDLKNLEVVNQQGVRIKLHKVVRFEPRPGAFVIRRKNAKRVFSLTASLDQTLMTPLRLVGLMKPQVEEVLQAYPTMTYSFGGENEDTQESMSDLARAALISLMGIAFILIVLFRSFWQPLMILLSIPLGFVGVIITFLLVDWSLGFMALLGVIGLTGVVVNDSIVLLNFINFKLEEHPQDGLKAILEASFDRFRPVLLTTLTTVAGLLPIALDPGGDPFLKPMALSFAGGLLFSTLVTLIFIPCLRSIGLKPGAQ